MDNASGLGELDNLLLSASSVPDSLHPSALIMSGSPCSSIPVESTDPTNSISDFLADVLLNLFGNFGIDASSNLAVNPVPFLAIPTLSDHPALGQFL